MTRRSDEVKERQNEIRRKEKYKNDTKIGRDTQTQVKRDRDKGENR